MGSRAPDDSHDIFFAVAVPTFCLLEPSLNEKKTELFVVFVVVQDLLPFRPHFDAGDLSN